MDEVSYLFDSDVCIDLLRGKNSALLEKYRKIPTLECLTSSVVEGELWVGVRKAGFSERQQIAFETFLSGFSVLPVDREVARKYGEVRAGLELSGIRIGANDLFIAATALVYDLTLVTRNRREYERVPGLKLETI